MKIAIKKVNGKWEVNGKPCNTLHGEEKRFLDSFFSMMKQEEEITTRKIREVQDRATNRVVKEIQNYQFKQTHN